MELRALFDYFLTAEGEEPLAAIRDRVAAEAARALDDVETARAIELFDRYVAYRRQGEALLATRPADPVGALAELQRGLFGADDAARMFSADLEALRAALE